MRIVVSLLMAFHTDDLLLFPLAFIALVMQKTYTIAKSALVPSVVRTEEELVEANSKLGLISGLVGAVAVVPAGVLQKTVGPTATLLYGALWFAAALVHARRLPARGGGDPPAGPAERVELHSPAVVIAATAMTAAARDRSGSRSSTCTSGSAATRASPGSVSRSARRPCLTMVGQLDARRCCATTSARR